MTEQERIESIKKNGGAHLKSFKEENITYDMCVAAVSMDAMAVTYIPPKYLSAEIYAMACRFLGTCLRFVPSELITEEMCLDAVRSEAASLEHIPEQYRTVELYHEAALRHPYAFRYMPVELITPEFCGKVVEKTAFPP